MCITGEKHYKSIQFNVIRLSNSDFRIKKAYWVTGPSMLYYVYT